MPSSCLIASHSCVQYPRPVLPPFTMGAHWLEIQAAVPISVLAGLITEIGSKQNEATIIQSIDTSRTDRTLKMATDDNVLHTHPVETFITLGSP